MTPYYAEGGVTIHHGDSLDVLRSLPDSSVHSVVTDPPYGIAFMGKQWDQPGQFGSQRKAPGPNLRRGDADAALEAGRYDLSPSAMLNFQQWCEEWARECLRVLKPGGHMLAFGGSRTWHRLACAVEDAGFEIRDSIAWMYGSGFPKSLDVSKAIDKAAGAAREVVGLEPDRWTGKGGVLNFSTDRAQSEVAITGAPATPDAVQWQGWGTALKPAFEPIVVGRKPLVGTVAANVLAHGTGALNIDACRVGDGAESQGARPAHEASAAARYADTGSVNLAATPGPRGGSPSGRWPANVILEESQAAVLNQQAPDTGGSGKASGPSLRDATDAYGARLGFDGDPAFYGDTGGASRFFYVAKADASERVRIDGIAHPTVKPLDLMRWLVRLVTPPGGIVLEPFAGSGTTVEACLLEGFDCIAIEREADYLPLIRQRLDRRRDPVAAVRSAGEDAGLFDLLEGA